MAQKISVNVAIADNLLPKTVRRDIIEPPYAERKLSDDYTELEVENNEKKEDTTATKSSWRARRASCGTEAHPFSTIALENGSAVLNTHHEKINESIPSITDTKHETRGKPMSRYEQILRNRKFITSRRMSDVDTTYIHQMSSHRDGGAEKIRSSLDLDLIEKSQRDPMTESIQHTLKHLDEVQKPKPFAHPSKFYSHADTSILTKEESVICDKGSSVQPVNKSLNNKQQKRLPSVVTVEREKEKEETFLGYRSLCMKLKLNKILKKDKDSIDILIWNSRSKPANPPLNQELSSAIRSLSKGSPHVTKIIHSRGKSSANENVKRPFPPAPKQIRHIRIKEIDRNHKSYLTGWESNWS